MFTRPQELNSRQNAPAHCSQATAPPSGRGSTGLDSGADCSSSLDGGVSVPLFEMAERFVILVESCR